MKCDICQTKVPEMENLSQDHLVINKRATDGHIHIHGDLDRKTAMKELLTNAAEEIGISLNGHKPLEDLKEVVFHNKQRIGDALVFTCAIRDFKLAYPHIRVGVTSIAMHIWDHNPYIDRNLIATPENTIRIGAGRLTNASNRLDWHFCNGYRYSIEEALKINIPQGESRPDIWFTQEEYNAPRLWKQPYWVICTTGERGWGCKMWPHEKWQAFVEQNPDITFVQIGSKEDNPPRLQGKNIIDHVGMTQSNDTGIRDLFKLFLNAEGSIGLVSFHMHLSGGMRKPCIVVAGAREPVAFTRYPGHQYLATDGCLPCAVSACWHCALPACTNLINPDGSQRVLTVQERNEGSTQESKKEYALLTEKLQREGVRPKCVDIIEVEDLNRALYNYYNGGRLVMGQVSAKPKLKNVVKDPIVYVKPVEPKEDIETYGMTFGGGSLTDRDWRFIRKTIKDYSVHSVVEFGAGLSTLLLNDLGVKVTSYETSPGWIKKIRDLKPSCDIRHWDGVTAPDPSWHVLKSDMVFVDGPSGDKSRELSTKLAAEYADIVVVHDAGREWARKYQDEFLKGKFNGPIKGGHRCHLWIRSGKIAPINPVKNGIVEVKKEVDNSPLTPVGIAAQKLVGSSTKTIKIVSTARGWGGCARSVTTIMRMLLKAGHKVEFIPFRNAVTSSEWKAILSGELNNVKVTADYSTLHEQCDVLLLYGDDYIWEFGKPEIVEYFENINAERKIMMLNYRRGKVGEIPWTKGWDKYMFLNSTQEQELLKFEMGAWTKVLPPCTDLTEFFKVKPDYEGSLRIRRHSSQGDTKFDKENTEKEIIDLLLARPDVWIQMLPGPSFVQERVGFTKIHRTADEKEVAAFLGSGNLFWYSLPKGYMDMGPRVILEAMAAGLPILADNWGGVVDRVTDDCGWLCNTKEEYTNVVKGVTTGMLRKFGEAARERAFQEFRPEKWIEELIP